MIKSENNNLHLLKWKYSNYIKTNYKNMDLNVFSVMPFYPTQIEIDIYITITRHINRVFNNRHLYPLFMTFTNNDILVYKFCSHLVAFCVPWVFVWDNLWYRQIYVLILQWVQTQTDIDCMVFANAS